MITITNGHFQMPDGTAVANGKLTLQLTQDANASSVPAQIASGVPISVPLDSSGNVSGTVNVWSQPELTPTTYYLAQLYDSNGTQVWTNPQVWTLPNTSPLDLGTIIPTEL